MSKDLSAGYLAHIAGGRITTALAMRVTRVRDGEILGFTEHHRSVELPDGVYYDATQGFSATGIITAANLAVGNLVIRTLDDGTLFKKPDIENRLWAGAKFYIFRYNWADTSMEVEPVLAGTFGEISVDDNGELSIKLRDLKQRMQAALGENSSKLCRARLGDERCGVDLDPFTYTVTVTAADADRRTFTVSAYYGSPVGFPDSTFHVKGELVWIEGANEGAANEVMAFSAGEFTLTIPMGYAIVPGDRATVTAGCDHTKPVCGTKFDNVRRYRGEWERPTVDQLIKKVDVNV